MPMDIATVRKVASLSRLAVQEDELDKYAVQLGGILQWVEQLASVNTDNIEPLANVVNIDLQLRTDAVTDGNRQEDVLANAPESVEGFFVVPKVVE